MWCLPTMSRPQQCAEVLQRIKEKDCTSKGLVFVNGKSHHQEYADLVVRHLPEKWRIVFHDENLGAPGALNYIFKKYPEEKFYGFIGDDEFVEKEGFDKILIDAAGDWDFSHGHIGEINMKRAQGFLCVGGKLAHAVGYMAIPTCWHWFGLDNMWEAIAQNSGCRNVFCDEIGVEHKHPYYGKAQIDRCYKLGEANVATDHYEYSVWIHTELPKVLERIKKAKAA